MWKNVENVEEFHVRHGEDMSFVALRMALGPVAD